MNDNYPSRSGYNQPQRQTELPSFNPRNPRMAVLDDNYADSFVAPLEQNANNQTSPEERAEERGKFPIINWSDVGSQIGKELTKQLINTSIRPRSDPAKSSQESSVANCGY